MIMVVRRGEGNNMKKEKTEEYGNERGRCTDKERKREEEERRMEGGGQVAREGRGGRRVFIWS